MNRETHPERLAHCNDLQEAAILLVAADDDCWDALLPIFERLEGHDPATWRCLAVATLETMVTRNACEALSRDPWNSVAPLLTRLLVGLARNIPADPRR